MKTAKLSLNTLLLLLILLVGIGILVSVNHRKHASEHAEPHMDKQVTGIPVMPGQEAFGTIQEIIGILEADPNTDWKKVNIDALQAHLIDMDEVTMHTLVKRENIPHGLRMAITGKGRTIGAIKRMVPTHNKMTLSTFKQWHTKVEIIDNGAILTVTSDDPKEVDKIRGLGFIGIMSVSSNHPMHHLMMAKGMAHMMH